MKIYISSAACLVCYFLNLSVYAQTQKGADIDGEAAEDESGYSVSMPDANTIAIGATNHSGSDSLAGHVRVYSWSSAAAAWLQKGSDIDGESAGDRSGYSVCMPDSNTVAIGSPYNNGNGTNSGHVRVYQWAGSSWVQKGTDIDGAATDDWSGASVNMPDANTLAIGSPYHDGSGSDAGHVRVFTWTGSAWVQKGTDIEGEAAEDRSGNSVSMPDANTIAIGAIANQGVGLAAGHVRIYSWSGSAWLQKGSDIDAEADYNELGCSVGMPDANTVAIGAHHNSDNGTNAGHVRVYRWNSAAGAWVQKGSDMDGEAVGDRLGWSVSMPDSNTVAMGAPWNDGSASMAGHVRVYQWNGTAWVQLGTDLDGEAGNDWSGWSVSMPDKNTLAVGAYRNDGAGSDAGHVRVYQGFNSVEISSDEFNSNIRYYPNPAQGLLNISLGNLYSDITVIARNEAGQEAGRQQYAHAGKLQFTLPEAAGMYLIEITAEGRKAVMKVVKE